MKKSLIDYVNYRISRANETFSDAVVLAERNRWNSCVNRLYYSCFYMVSALLIMEGLSYKTHTGIRTKFFSDYIKMGIIDKDYGKLYSDLFDWRNEGDYGDFTEFDAESVLPVMEKTKEFLSLLDVHIKNLL